MNKQYKGRRAIGGAAPSAEIHLEKYVTGLVQAGGDLCADETQTMVAVAGHDMALQNGGGAIFVAGNDFTLTNGGAGIIATRGDLSLTNGGCGVLLAGGDVDRHGISGDYIRLTTIVSSPLSQPRYCCVDASIS